MRHTLRAGLMGVLLATATLAGCASAYYGAMEQIGLEKRDLLVQRVNDAAVSQAHAKTEFANALEAFRAVVTVDAGELEVTYDKLTAAYERSADRADKVRDRIREVKGVASDLFKEWEKELYQYSDPALQRASRIQLEATKVRYATLVEKMDKAAASMDPVLAVFHDRVLFLKHNLNAMAIAALGPETAGLEADVDSLIRDMEASIAEADAFMAQMRGGV